MHTDVDGGLAAIQSCRPRARMTPADSGRCARGGYSVNRALPAARHWLVLRAMRRVITLLGTCAAIRCRAAARPIVAPRPAVVSLLSARVPPCAGPHAFATRARASRITLWFQQECAPGRGPRTNLSLRVWPPRATAAASAGTDAAQTLALAQETTDRGRRVLPVVPVLLYDGVNLSCRLKPAPTYDVR